MSESESEAEYSSSSSEISEQLSDWKPMFMSPAGRRRDIPTVVYIHGIAGSQYDTWQLTTHSPLPDMVREYLHENTRSDHYGFSTIINYQYDSHKLLANDPVDGKSSLEHFALELLEEIWRWRNDEIFDPIVMVTHDIGSIIAKKAILLARNYTRYRPIAIDVQRLIQFGTAQTSDTPQWEKIMLSLSYAVKDVQLREALAFSPWKDIASQFATVTKQFRSFSEGYTSFSIYQEIPDGQASTYEIIVDKEAATKGMSAEFTIARRQSHLALCKFSPEDDQLKHVSSIVLDVVREKEFDHYRDKYFSLLSQLTPTCGPLDLLAASQSSEVSFEWVLHDEVFRSWRSMEYPSLLHIHGSQGAGKTSIARFLANHFVENEATDGAAVAAFFFKYYNTYENGLDDHNCSLFKYDHTYENGLDDLCRSLTSQLLLAKRNIFRQILDLHVHAVKRSGRSQKPFITMPSAWYLLRTILSCHSQAPIFCVVDAVDDGHGDISAMLTELIELSKVSTNPFKIIITSTTGDKRLGGILSKIPFQICLDEGNAMQREAGKNINAAAKDLTQKRHALRLFSDDIAQRIRQSQPLNVLDASLKIRYLETVEILSTPSSVKSVVDKISRNAPSVIFDINNEHNPLDITDPGLRRWASRVLSWMTYAFRPLRLGELATGLAMLNWSSPNPADEHLSRDIEADLKYILGAVVIIQNEVVIFAHTDIQQAVNAWVKRQQSSEDPERVCHHTIARVCLAYLSPSRLREAVTIMRSLRYEPMTQLSDRPEYWRKFGFILYAAQYWPDHFRDREVFLNEDVKQVKKFLGAAEARDDWLLLDEMVSQRIIGPLINISHLTSCAIAARLNLPRVVKSILSDAAGDIHSEVRPGDICVHASAGNCLPVLEHIFSQMSSQVSANDLRNALLEALRNGASEAVDLLVKAVETHAGFGAQDGWLYQAAAAVGNVQLLSKLLKPTIVFPSDMSKIIRAAAWVNNQTTLSLIFSLITQFGKIRGSHQNTKDADQIYDISEFHALALYDSALCGHSGIVRSVSKLLRLRKHYQEHGRNALHIASMLGYSTMIPCLLKSVDIDSTDNRKRSPLHLAAAYGSAQIIDLLISAGADCNMRDANDETPLFLAVREKQDETVQRLLSDTKVQRNIVNKHKQHILHIAISTGSLPLVTSLVNSSTDLERCDATKMTPLHYAISLEFIEIALFLIDKQVNLETEDEEGATPLLCSASKRRMSQVMERLLDNNANAMATDTFGLTSLHRAAQKGSMVGIDILLRFRPDLVDARDPRDRTALHYAADKGHRGCIERLLFHGASLNITDDYSQRPINYAAELKKYEGACVMLRFAPKDVIEPYTLRRLFHNAAMHGDEEATRLVLERCENKTEIVNSTDDVSDSGIFNAVWGGSMEITQYVLEQGANISLTTNHKRGVLQRAVHKNNIDLARLLLKNGALVDHSSPSEGTALHVAAKLVLMKMVEFLVIEHKADVNALDSQLMTPLQTGVTDVSIVRMLHEQGADLNPTRGLSSVLNRSVQKFVPESSSAVLGYLFDHGASVKDGDVCGLTATHSAARFGKLELVIDFVQKDPAALRRKDKQGRTPLHLAAAGNHDQIVVFILDKLGLESLGNIDLADNDGWNPLHWSCKGWCSEVWEILLKRGIDHRQPTKNGWIARDIATYHTFGHEFEDKIKEHPQLEDDDTFFTKIDYSKHKLGSLDKSEDIDGVSPGIKRLVTSVQGDEAEFGQKIMRRHLKGITTDQNGHPEPENDLENEQQSSLSSDEDEVTDSKISTSHSKTKNFTQTNQQLSVDSASDDDKISDSDDEESVNQTDPEATEFNDPVLDPETGLPLEAATVQEQKCTACACVICGPLFECKTCKTVFYCFKCAWSRQETHPGHRFEIMASEEENPSPTPRHQNGDITKYRKPSKPRKASNARRRIR